LQKEQSFHEDAEKRNCRVAVSLEKLVIAESIFSEKYLVDRKSNKRCNSNGEGRSNVGITPWIWIIKPGQCHIEKNNSQSQEIIRRPIKTMQLFCGSQ
jgi:hypothetical protein